MHVTLPLVSGRWVPPLAVTFFAGAAMAIPGGVVWIDGYGPVAAVALATLLAVWIAGVAAAVAVSRRDRQLRRSIVVNAAARTITVDGAVYDLGPAFAVETRAVRSLPLDTTVRVLDVRRQAIWEQPCLSPTHGRWLAGVLARDLGLTHDPGPVVPDEVQGHPAQVSPDVDHVDLTVWSHPVARKRWLPLLALTPFVKVLEAPQVLFSGVFAGMVLMAASAGVGVLLAGTLPRSIRLRIDARALHVVEPTGRRSIPIDDLNRPEVVALGARWALVLTSRSGWSLDVIGRPHAELAEIARWIEQARAQVRALPDVDPIDVPEELVRMRERIHR